MVFPMLIYFLRKLLFLTPVPGIINCFCVWFFVFGGILGGFSVSEYWFYWFCFVAISEGIQSHDFGVLHNWALHNFSLVCPMGLLTVYFAMPSLCKPFFGFWGGICHNCQLFHRIFLISTPETKLITWIIWNKLLLVLLLWLIWICKEHIVLVILMVKIPEMW